ncbi:uncharacterized protein DUF2690 [Streptomyces sp. 846.5]|nr:uncharacterized protein DUF2690 [Streptomyces sp. 846.5]
MRTRILAMAATGLTAATLALSLPTQASAATYDGQDPAASGCSSTAVTAKSAPIYRGDGAQVGTIQLRYSTKCRTVWARIITPYNAGIAVVHRNTDNATEACPINTNTLKWSSSLGDYSCYTPMLNDANVTSYAWGQVDGPWGSTTVAYTGSY